MAAPPTPAMPTTSSPSVSESVPLPCFVHLKECVRLLDHYPPIIGFLLVSADTLLTRQCCVSGSQLASNSATLYQKQRKKAGLKKRSGSKYNLFGSTTLLQCMNIHWSFWTFFWSWSSPFKSRWSSFKCWWTPYQFLGFVDSLWSL